MIDELYSDRVAGVDLFLLAVGAPTLIAGFALAAAEPWLPVGAAMVTGSAALTVANLTGTVLVHWLDVTPWSSAGEPEQVREN